MKAWKNWSIGQLMVSAILLFNAAWTLPMLAILIVPAMAISIVVAQKSHKALLHLYLIFAGWNLGTTYWIANAHPLGVIATVGINGLLMALALWWGVRTENMFLRFPWFAKWKIGSFLPIIAGWLAFEQLHEDWGLSFPWLNLGNTFHSLPSWIQWYSITGAIGGTIWVLLLAQFLAKSTSAKTTALTFALPMILSISLFYWPSNNDQPTIDVAVVQPNIDAYEEKWELPERAQIQKVRRLLAANLNQKKVDLIVLPETFLPKAREEGAFGRKAEDAQLVQLIQEFSSSAIFGATTYDFQEEPTVYNRPYGSKFYTLYNSALFTRGSTDIDIYHKGKLVVGGETMPFVALLKPILGDWSVALGGTSGTLGVSEERKVFEKPELGLKLAPIICWENEFSNYSTEYARKGANLIAVITNDGWWGDTPGHRQHLRFSGLRAIEQGKYVVRSANTGISAIIDHKGRVMKSIGWEEEGVLKATVPLKNNNTIYVRTGNILGPIFVALFLFANCVILLSRFFRLKAA